MSAVDVLAVMDEAALSQSISSDRADMREARAAVAELIDVMNEFAEYLRDRSDVIDGDYGQPAPNAEMTLLREVESALARVHPMTREQQAAETEKRA